ncbi:hypothetical protein [Kocuria tytonis]|uniref:Uncharacterized protein n=1 Tax=Kocuria tytonis TaxID=2054280 RepID=A0A495A444_9MICC|nr:hypothetical protein [Kocuria tytonis]RKQ34142.1 hypothetical protein C1C97_009875 [Kocuria tytonis]
MALSVSPCGNRKTWDARVRVTGGHPDLLWGIGEAEALTREHVRVERVAVDRGEQTVGYGQLLVLTEGYHTVVDAKSLHVKNPRDLVTVLAALQEHARDAHHAAVLRASPDTHATTELAAQLGEAGYRRRDRPRRGEAGPRHLVVRLGETEGELSKRLSSETLQRCRAGLRDSGVRVRRVNAADRDLSHVGLRTQHIRELLRAVGENSVFLVATERPEDGPETALGYLWFVHTGESAMIYRLGFTDRARQLGVDDALLLTGLVQLQQRQVHRVLAGDPDQPGQPMVLRELATEDMEVLGTWEYPLAGEFQLAGRAEKTRRRIFGRRGRRSAPEQLLPDPTTASGTADRAPDPQPTAVERDDAAAAPVTPVAPAVDADPDLVRPEERATPSAGEAQSTADTPADTGHRPGKRTRRLLPVPRITLPGTDGRARDNAPAHDGRDGNATADAAASSAPDGADRGGSGSSSATLLGRVMTEGRAAVRDAARW